MGKVRQKLAKRKKIKYLKKKSFISKYAQDRIDEVTKQGQDSQKKKQNKGQRTGAAKAQITFAVYVR